MGGNSQKWRRYVFICSGKKVHGDFHKFRVKIAFMDHSSLHTTLCHISSCESQVWLIDQLINIWTADGECGVPQSPRKWIDFRIFSGQLVWFYITCLILDWMGKRKKQKPHAHGWWLIGRIKLSWVLSFFYFLV